MCRPSSLGQTAPKMEDMCTADSCFKEFRRLILQHAVKDPSGQPAVFTGDEVRMLTDFVKLTFFKHFLLYQYCLNFALELHTLEFKVELDKPPPPPKFDLSCYVPPKVDPKQYEAEHQQEAESEDQEVQRLVEERLQETEA